MQSRKYVKMNAEELEREIQKKENKIGEIRNDISILKSLKFACEVREREKAGNHNSQNDVNRIHEE